MIRFWVALLLSLVGAGAAAAHDFWIQPANFRIAPGGTTSVAILVGHGPARQPWVLRLNRVVGLISVAPDGRRTNHSGTLRQGTYAPDPTVTLGMPGTHVVAFENTPTTNSLPADRFNDYVRAEGIRPIAEWRVRTGAGDQPGRERYSRRAKALVRVGPLGAARPSQATRPVGLTLEIVPEIDPYAPGNARMLPVRIIYQGRFVAGAFVKLTNLDSDAQPVATRVTDGNGRTLFPLPHQGRWQLNVVWSRPLSGDPEADFETVFSSLTFGFSS